ncbi:hypothetical protein GGR92_004801 [Spirosoma lacussanchae]|uniref:hypothetical protein n=1 Tax=Spirosoma lacussanchae TaxID=1884249 RepID=UPI00110833C2|nr:hypothetical protein [Spirosoma lacussanchae]
MEEVLFINDKGEETYLPESVGEKLGYKRGQEFTPPEVDKQAKSVPEKAGKADKTPDQELEHAATVIFGFATNGPESVSDKQLQALDSLADRLNELGFGTDSTDSAQQSEGKDGNDDAGTSTVPPADTNEPPKEGQQPGKSTRSTGKAAYTPKTDDK